MFRSVGLFIALTLAGLAHAVEVKPEINGTIDNGCLLDSDENACAFMGTGSTRTGAVPSNIYVGLVSTADNTNYITIQDLSFQHSAGYGVRLGVNSDHIIVKNNTIGFSGFVAIGVRINGTQTLISGNSLYYSQLCSFKNRGQSDHNAPTPCKNSWPATIGMGGTNVHDAYSIAHNNDIYGGYGEAIGSYGVRYTWRIGNRVRGIRNRPELIDNSSYNLSESNIHWSYDTTGLTSVLGTNGYSGAPNWDGVGINFTIEPRSFCDGVDADGGTCETINNVARNNVIAAPSITGNGIYMNNRPNIGSPPNPNYNDSEPLGVAWVHNLVAGEVDFDNGTDEDYAKGELTFLNNAIMSTSTSGICGMYSSTGYETHSVDYNLWRVNPSDSHCDGANDTANGEISLTAGDVDAWVGDQCGEASCMDQSDFILTDTATGDDEGVRLNNVDVPWLEDTEWEYFSDVTFPGGGSITGANWEFLGYYDFTGQARSITPNIGPDETN